MQKPLFQTLAKWGAEMKVVLFCGGFGTRLRDYSESIPKPMVKLGYRPILWHVMRYYAHFGHKDFILCLGWKADYVKEYFLNYDECMSNDFVLSNGAKSVHLLDNDIQDWNITFVDTGTKANVGQRMRRVREHIGDDEMFLANYSDGLTDLHLPQLIDFAETHDSIGCFLAVQPNQTFHTVQIGEQGEVYGIEPISDSDTWIDGGYFVFRNEVFDHLDEGDDLVHECFSKLIADSRLHAMKYDGFWGCMDTHKDKQRFDEMYSRGEAPWEIWDKGQDNPQKYLNWKASGRQIRSSAPAVPR